LTRLICKRPRHSERTWEDNTGERSMLLILFAQEYHRCRR
jgi:hypothetical protein